MPFCGPGGDSNGACSMRNLAWGRPVLKSMKCSVDLGGCMSSERVSVAAMMYPSVGVALN